MKSAINSHFKSWASGGMVDTPVLGTGHASGEGSSPFSPTKNSRKSVYVSVYDMTTLSTKLKQRGVVNKGNDKVNSLRKNYTSLFNNTCDYYSLIISLFFKFNSTTQMWWSCRQTTIIINRHSLVFVTFMEKFSLCPQKHIRHHSNYN